MDKQNEVQVALEGVRYVLEVMAENGIDTVIALPYYMLDSTDPEYNWAFEQAVASMCKLLLSAAVAQLCGEEGITVQQATLQLVSHAVNVVSLCSVLDDKIEWLVNYYG